MLINRQGDLKIADLGFARKIQKDMTPNKVTTLWYRAPELLLGDVRYKKTVDFWSAGCIVFEFYTGSPLFRAKNEQELASAIFSLCGMPTVEEWKESRSFSQFSTLGSRFEGKRRHLREHLERFYIYIV